VDETAPKAPTVWTQKFSRRNRGRYTAMPAMGQCGQD